MLLRFSALLVLCVSVPVAVVDARHHRIPDYLSLGGLGAVCLLWLVLDPAHLPLVVVQGVFGFAVFALLHVLSGRRVGLGDAKFSALIAAGVGILGWCVTVAVASAAALLAAAVGLGSGRLRMDSRIPLGPFFAVGVLVAGIVIFLRPSWFRLPW